MRRSPVRFWQEAREEPRISADSAGIRGFLLVAVGRPYNRTEGVKNSLKPGNGLSAHSRSCRNVLRCELVAAAIPRTVRGEQYPGPPGRISSHPLSRSEVSGGEQQRQTDGHPDTTDPAAAFTAGPPSSIWPCGRRTGQGCKVSGAGPVAASGRPAYRRTGSDSTSDPTRRSAWPVDYRGAGASARESCQLPGPQGPDVSGACVAEGRPACVGAGSSSAACLSGRSADQAS